MKTKTLALGESWFHYPQGLDKDGNPVQWWERIFGGKRKPVGNIIHYLVDNHKIDLNYSEKTATQVIDAITNIPVSMDDTLGRCGEELMVMVYGYRRKYPALRVHNTTWLELLVRRISKYSSDHDKFIILLSAGGNDIVEDNLEDFLYHPDSPEGPVKTQAIDEAVNQHLKGAFEEIFKRVCTNFPTKQFHFLYHGYGYPPVNRRGVFTGLEKSNIEFLHKMSPGPWLSPYLIDKNGIPRPEAEKIIGDFIDMFNEMLANLQCSQPNGKLHYIDVRGITDKTNRDSGWCNEIHFDHTTFPQASKKFHDVIKTL